MLAKPILMALVVVGALLGSHFMAFQWGHARFEVKLLEAQRAADRKVEIIQGQVAQVKDRVVTKYVDRIKYIKGETREIRIETLVPVDTCPMPAGFRVLHDTAAQGGDPGASGDPDAAPVPAQDVAETVRDNYETCRETAEQLMALQDWIKQTVETAHANQ